METLTQTTENNKELQKVERVFKSMYKEKIKYIEGTLNNLYDFNNNILNNIKFLNSLIKKLNKDEKILNNKIITREIKELDINKGMILNDISILLETLEYSDEVYIERFYTFNEVFKIIRDEYEELDFLYGTFESHYLTQGDLENMIKEIVER